MSYFLQYSSNKAIFILLTLAVDKIKFLRQILYEIYTVVRGAIHLGKRRVYIRKYLVNVLFAYGIIIGYRKTPEVF